MNNHHSHEIEDHPEVKWALELLKPDPDHRLSVLQEYSPEIVCVGSGLATQCLYNWLQRKPYYARIQRHIIAMAIGYVASQVIKKYVNDYQGERDTRLRDYIIRHPELFPEPVRIKYSEVLEDWTPIR